MYAVHLLDSGQAGLLPPYACHLRADLRADVFALHLRLLTEVLVLPEQRGLCEVHPSTTWPSAVTACVCLPPRCACSLLRLG